MFTRAFNTFYFCAALAFVAVPVYAQGPSAFSDPGARAVGSGAAGEGLVPVLPNVDGGAVPTGATAQVVVRFKNTGAQPVETGLIRLYPSSTVSATISLNQCSEEPLNAGAECAIALSVKGLQAGAWRVEMLMSHSGRTRLVSATLSGTVESTGESSDRLSSDIEAIPDKVDFGSLTASQDLIEPVILRNITSTPIKISEIRVDSSDNAGFTETTQCQELQPGQACLTTVRWSPKLRGPASGVLVIKHDGPTALSSVPLRGIYAPESVQQAEVFPQAVPGRGLLVASQTEIDFGEDVEAVSTITVSLVNAGDSPMTIRDIAVAGSDSGLSIKAGGCVAGMVLDPIEACPLSVTWSPTRVGLLLDDIQVTHTGARGVLVLPVRGESIWTVPQDQGAIVLAGGSGAAQTLPGDGMDPATANQYAAAQQAEGMRSGGGFMPTVSNAANVLDGLKITSFSPTRAIVAGPGGSRIVFDGEDAVLGGVPWAVRIQRNGIEFTHQGQTVLMLFDRSLSSINRVPSPSELESMRSSSGSDSDSSSSRSRGSRSSRSSN